MYKDFYKLKENPFSIVANPEFLYLSSKHRLALTYLEYGISEGAGFILLTGDIGTGKTTLIKRVVKQFEHFGQIGVIFNTNISSQELLSLIVQEFEIDVPARDKIVLLDAFYRFLIQKYQQNIRVLLIIDEAQNLSDDVLEEVRMLSNLQSERTFLLQIILVGQPELRRKLQSPALAQLAQRISVSYHLVALKHEETREYIFYRLQKAYAEDIELFTEDAIKQIYEYSGGIPRLINILCDAALVYGYADELQTIDANIIDDVVENHGELGGLTSVSNRNQPNGLMLPEYEDNVALLARMQSLEEQMQAITVRQNWLIERLEWKFEDHRDDVVRKLEKMLTEERARNENLLLRCEQLEQKFRKNI